MHRSKATEQSVQNKLQSSSSPTSFIPNRFVTLRTVKGKAKQFLLVAQEKNERHFKFEILTAFIFAVCQARTHPSSKETF